MANDQVRILSHQKLTPDDCAVLAKYGWTVEQEPIKGYCVVLLCRPGDEQADSRNMIAGSEKP
jgi:hypothetical protein